MLNAKTPLLLFAFLFAILTAPAKAEDEIDFIFDLDQVLVDKVTDEPTIDDIEVYQSHYRITPGAPELLLSLLRRPGSRISFASSAQRVRNDLLLRAWTLPNGETALKLCEGRVMSAHDLSDQRKDISRFMRRQENSLFFDDRKEFIYPGQEQNFVWVPNSTSGARNNKRGQPLSKAYFHPDHRLVYLRGLIDAAISLHNEMGISLTQAMKQVQSRAQRNPDYRQERYQSGLTTLRAENPSFTPIALTSPTQQCDEALSHFFENTPPRKSSKK